MEKGMRAIWLIFGCILAVVVPSGIAIVILAPIQFPMADGPYDWVPGYLPVFAGIGSGVIGALHILRAMRRRAPTGAVVIAVSLSALLMAFCSFAIALGWMLNHKGS
jgi:hypothetical protein